MELGGTVLMLALAVPIPLLILRPLALAVPILLLILRLVGSGGRSAKGGGRRWCGRCCWVPSAVRS